MYVKKSFGIKGVLGFSGHHLIWLSAWAAIVTFVYEYTKWEWLLIPWLPLSVIGTAVAFYIGFKNNQAYDRLWEARKIWGGIVNSSRAWGTNVKSYATTFFADENVTQDDVEATKKNLIYRQIGWLYALRSQLLIPTEWEHISQGRLVQRATKKRIKQFGVGLLEDGILENNLRKYLPDGECDRLINYKNTATQIIDTQSQELKRIREVGIIDDFRHMELQKILNELLVHQGKVERIKKFPLPRQYGYSSFIFVSIFVLMLPFGMVGEFAKLGDWGTWLSIPFTAIVGWVFITMELVGDYSENPFEGMSNDIPMLSLCRTIEIDLLEMMGEKEIPEAIKPQKGILM